VGIPKIARRAWLRQVRAVAGVFPLGISPLFASRLLQHLAPPQKASPPAQGKPSTVPGSTSTRHPFSAAEDAFLEELERASFRYFWEEANPYTGLIKDRSQADGTDRRSTASIASTGFGLTALCIADRRGWEDGKKIRERVRNTLRFAATRLSYKNGFFFHFLNMQNGERDFQSAVSSIDSSIFLCGALTCCNSRAGAR
jgi:hypothetical protein